MYVWKKYVSRRVIEERILVLTENQPVSSPEAEESETEEASNRRLAINIYLFPEEKENLRVLAFEERKKIHDLLIEGIDRVLADRGLETITERRKKNDA